LTNTTLNFETLKKRSREHAPLLNFEPQTMNIALFFGTFNPFHNGHLAVGKHMVELPEIDEVWLVVTPHSPFKKKSTLLENHHRLEMVSRAIKDFPQLKPCDIEFDLPQPNYTINTLKLLNEKYPNNEFSLIMGEDNLGDFDKWKDSELILKAHEIYVYPRTSDSNIPKNYKNHPKIHGINAPIVDISATYIREAIDEEKNVQKFLPESVWEYIKEVGLYK